MIRGNVKLVGEIKPDEPNKGVAAALVEAARINAESQRSLVEAIQGITAQQAQVQVVHHETVRNVSTPVPVPKRRVFQVERDGAGLLSKIVANRLTFTPVRDEQGLLVEIIVEAK